MVALAVGLTRNPSPAAIVGYSGALANAEALAERSGSGPAILLVHGHKVVLLGLSKFPRFEVP